MIQHVKIELGGEERTLIEDFNALRVFEQSTGLNSLDGATYADMDATTTVAWLRALLVNENPDLTEEDVGGWIGPHNMVYVYDKLAEHQKNAVAAAGGEKDEDPNGSPSDGSTSGPSDATTSGSPKKGSGRAPRRSSEPSSSAG